MSQATITVATPADAAELFDLINEAYEVETGDSGVAFKNTLRLIDREKELDPLIESGRFLLARNESGQLLGCLYYKPESDSGVVRVHFGPLATAPAAKGQGLAKRLIAAMEAIAREMGAISLDLEVVHVRSDIIPMYEKWGFRQWGTGPFPAPERCTRDVHFILMRRDL